MGHYVYVYVLASNSSDGIKDQAAMNQWKKNTEGNIFR